MLKCVSVFFVLNLPLMAVAYSLFWNNKTKTTEEKVEDEKAFYTNKLFSGTASERLKAIRKLSLYPFLGSDQYDKLTRLAVFDPYDQIQIEALKIFKNLQTPLGESNIQLLEQNLSAPSLQVRQLTYSVLSIPNQLTTLEIKDKLRNTLSMGLMKDQPFKQYYNETNKISNSNWYVKLMGIWSLGRKKSQLPQELQRRLSDLILDPSLIVRVMTLKALSRFEPPLQDLVIQRKIIGALFDSNLRVRMEALRALNRLHWVSDERATWELSFALMDSSSYIVIKVMYFLEKLAKAHDPYLIDYLTLKSQRQSYETHTIMDYLSRLMENSSDQSIRIQVLNTLGVLGKLAVSNYKIQTIVALGLRDSFYSVRLASVSALLTMGYIHPTIQEEIRPLLDDSSETIRDIAYQILYSRTKTKKSKLTTEFNTDTCKKVF